MHAALAKHCQSLFELAAELAPVTDQGAEFWPRTAVVNDNSEGNVAASWQQICSSHVQH